MPKGDEGVRLRSFGFRWHCVCGASWGGNLVRTPANPCIEPVLGLLKREWERAHSGPGHRRTRSGREAAWARRRAEREAEARWTRA